VKLSHAPRQLAELAQAIVAFRCALESQLPEQIELSREWLLQLMARLRQ
jgi:hypothetical protein